MLKSGLGCGVALLLLSCRADNEADKRAIAALSAQWSRAEVERNPDAMLAVLAPDFVYVGPDGAKMGASEDASALRDPDFRIGESRNDDVRVDVFGDVAVEAGVEVIGHASYRGQALDGRYRFVTVWRKGRSGWRAIYAQETAVSGGVGQHSP